MKIRSLKDYWIVVWPNGVGDAHTIYYKKSGSIKEFEKVWTKGWKWMKKEYGVVCVRVDINFEIK